MSLKLLQVINPLGRYEDTHVLRNYGQEWWEMARILARNSKSPSDFLRIEMKYQEEGSISTEMVYIIGKGGLESLSMDEFPDAALFYLKRWHNNPHKRFDSVKALDISKILDLDLVIADSNCLGD
ncbi:MAG: hypothetical protein ACOCUU_02595 [Nanoarchaeota archaeon]